MQRHHKIIAVFNGCGRMLMNHMLNTSQCIKNIIAVMGFLIFMPLFTFLLFPQLEQKFNRKQDK